MLGDIPTEAAFLLKEKKSEQHQCAFIKQNRTNLYTYTLVNEFPHDKQAYTQGLEFDGETLYESTGLKGKSSLRRVNYKTGAIRKTN